MLFDGSIYRRAPGGAAYEPLFALGPAVVAARLGTGADGSISWLQPPNRLLTAQRPRSFDCASVSIEERVVAGLTLDGVRVDLLHRTNNESWLAIGAFEGQGLRLDLALEQRPRQLRRRPLGGAELVWRRGVEIAPDHFVLLSHSGGFARTRGRCGPPIRCRLG